MESLSYIGQLFRKYPPHLALDIYRDILFFGEEYINSLEFPAEVGIILCEIKPIVEEIKNSQQFINYRREDLKNLVRFVVSDKSAKRLVVWGIWRLLDGDTKGISIYDILMEVSYPDEIYQLILSEGGIVEKGVKSSSFLLMSPAERIVVVKKEKEFECSSDEIIRLVRMRELQELIKVLKKLNLKVSQDGWINIDNNSFETIKQILLMSYARLWPYFGTYVFRGEGRFKLLGGQSNKVYVDIPNGFIWNIIEKITSENSKGMDEFYAKTREFLHNKNMEAHSQGYSWLKFRVEKREPMKKIGIKVSINWPEFVKFIENFSKDSNKKLWEKYEYISNARFPALWKLLEGKDINWEKVAIKVKDICSEDLESINNELSNIKKSLDKANKVWNNIFTKRLHIHELPSAYASYYIEGTHILESIGWMARKGMFPSGYRELRKLLETLSVAFFADYLMFQSIIQHKMVFGNYFFLMSKKWYTFLRKLENTRSSLKKTFGNAEMNKCLGILNESLKNKWKLPGKDKFRHAFIMNITHPSFVLLFGHSINLEALNKKKQKCETLEIPTYKIEDLLPYAQQDFVEVGKSLGVSSPQDFARDVISYLKRSFNSSSVVPPYPSFDLMISLTEKWSSVKGLNAKYDEYSTFIHAYPDTLIVFPFSSVLEVKTFRYELSQVEKIVRGLTDAYITHLRNVKAILSSTS